jgi:hypothetical protein
VQIASEAWKKYLLFLEANLGVFFFGLPEAVFKLPHLPETLKSEVVSIRNGQSLVGGYGGRVEHDRYERLSIALANSLGTFKFDTGPS